MIAQIRGEVTEVLNGSIIVDTGGLGYEVQISQIDQEKVQKGEDIKLYTYFHVRENAHELFGFTSIEAKQLFEMLISVSGVGPKGAMAIMSLGDVGQIKNAISSGNIAYITGASGIGKKAAERITIDLKDKVGFSGEYSSLSQNTSDDALDALVALGYSSVQSSNALSQIKEDQTTEDRIKQALKVLSQ